MAEAVALLALQSPMLAALPGVRHGFFGRRGGVSGGLYGSLNVGLGTADSAAAVAENRRRAGAALGLTGGDRLLTPYQVHSARVHVVAAPWDEARPDGDGVVTATAGLAAAVVAADCAPVLMADAQARVVAAAHAGWRGALAGVVEAALDAMERLGAARGRIVAAIGPCISQDAYEVGPDLAQPVLDRRAADSAFFRPGRGDRLHFDLRGYVAQRLADAGVAAVWRAPDCTFAQEADYFSYRRARLAGATDYGRNLSAICLDSEQS